MNVLTFLDSLKWVDGSPLRAHLEPYRRALFAQALDTRDPDGRPRYNLVLAGRAKKNWKTADLVLACLYALCVDAPAGNQVYCLANDEGQAGDDLSLAKKIVAANPALRRRLTIQKREIKRRDGRGFLAILPAKDVAGAHGKTYRLAAFDEIHEYRDWDLLEAMQLDPTRPEAQIWITSYASLYHKPGVPLFDLCQRGWAGSDPRMIFSWYGADKCTDPAFAAATAEDRANPSRASWADPDYLAQQQARLPSHKYRRLHLNLPGLPAGAPFQPEMVMDAIARGCRDMPYQPDASYAAFVDMSGGSNDDAVLAIGCRSPEGHAVIVRLVDQGPPPPFDPTKAVGRFVTVLREYHLSRVTGDRYAGETFRAAFQEQGVAYHVCDQTKSEVYEALEPLLNAQRVVFPDEPKLEQQLLGLVWRGGKIDHLPGEHDDYANAAAGCAVALAAGSGPSAGYVPVVTGHSIVQDVLMEAEIW